jgi:hypothetical protein
MAFDIDRLTERCFMARKRFSSWSSACALVFLAQAGCVSSVSLDPYLDKAVGRQVGDIEYLPLGFRKVMADDGHRFVVQYSIDPEWHCRWVFEIEKETSVVKAWRYPDPDAAKRCRALPASMP